MSAPVTGPGRHLADGPEPGASAVPGASQAPEAAPVPSPFASLGAGIDSAVSRGLTRLTGTTVAPYQSAVVRIGISLTWLLYLIREFPHRSELYGPDSPWSFDLAKRIIASNHAFSVLMWNDGRAWFELVYAVALLSALTLLLGWRTRTSALLFMIGVLSLQNRSIFMGDGGDNVIHLMAIYLAFTRCGQVWSLDRRRAERRAARRAAAGREGADDGADVGVDAGADDGADPVGIALWTVLGACLVAAVLAGKLSSGWALIFWACWAGQAVWWAVRRYAPGEPRTVLGMVANVVHGGAMLVIAGEVCLIYSTAGWYKIQGSRWQDGTAPYYPLHLDDFTPWPALSHALAGNSVMIMLVCYGTVIIQVAFPFTLFNRRVKNVLLPAMMLEHVSIAITLGLPFFSLAMIAADAVFLPTSFLRWAGDRLARLVRPRRESPQPVTGGRQPAETGDGAAEPAPAAEPAAAIEPDPAEGAAAAGKPAPTGGKPSGAPPGAVADPA
jgi:hypothetical protein